MHACDTTPLTAPQARWLVGTARQLITPQQPIWLYGYVHPNRFQPATGVLSNLYVDALVLDAANDEPALLLCFDLCVMRKPLAEAIVAKVSEATGIRRDRILLNVSHTHSGPALDQADLAGRFPLQPAEQAAITEYTQWLQAQAVACAEAALAARQPARLSWSVGNTSIPCNRRKLNADGQWTGMGPNPAGDIDRRLPVLRIDDPHGAARALVFACACHNVTLDSRNLLVSADYAGFARDGIEAALPGCQAIFMIGCGADANTEPRGGDRQVELTRQHGQTLASEVLQALEQPARELLPPLHCALTTVQLPLQSLRDRPALERLTTGPEWQTLNVKKILQAMDDGQCLPESYGAPLSVWQFGDALTLIGLPGEVVSQYARRLYDLLGEDQLWVAGYCNEVFGYLPSRQILNEGGYETRGLLPPGIGIFAPAVEDAVAVAAAALVSRLRDLVTW